MKNKNFFIISVLLAILFSSCSLIPRVNTEIHIYDCEHGRLEVKRISEIQKDIEFMIIGHPDEGYCLLAENLYIYAHEESESILFGNEINEYINPITNLDYENTFNFTLKAGTRVTISAFFTKIAQE